MKVNVASFHLLLFAIIVYYSMISICIKQEMVVYTD